MQAEKTQLIKNVLSCNKYPKSKHSKIVWFENWIWKYIYGLVELQYQLLSKFCFEIKIIALSWNSLFEEIHCFLFSIIKKNNFININILFMNRVQQYWAFFPRRGYKFRCPPIIISISLFLLSLCCQYLGSKNANNISTFEVIPFWPLLTIVQKEKKKSFVS